MISVDPLRSHNLPQDLHLLLSLLMVFQYPVHITFPFRASLHALCTLDLVTACLTGGTQTSSKELFPYVLLYPLLPQSSCSCFLFRSYSALNSNQHALEQQPEILMVHFDFHSPSLSVCLLLGFPAFFYSCPCLPSSHILSHVSPFCLLQHLLSSAAFSLMTLFHQHFLCAYQPLFLARDTGW